MIRRFFSKNKKATEYEVRFTSDSTWTVPTGCASMSAFLVGGGGGGGGYGGWWGASNGGSGSGGGTNTINDIAVTPGTTVTITIGAGGARGARGGNGSAGGTTSITLNGTTYSALGGNPGLAGIQSNDHLALYSSITGKSRTHGNTSYDNSGIFLIDDPNSSTTRLIYNANKVLMKSFVASSWSEFPATIQGNGVPEFWISGNKTHASGGLSNAPIKPLTSYEEGSGGTIAWSYGSDSCTFYGGGGYGGGGAGGSYYYNNQSKGSAGGSGIVIIKYIICS